MPVQGVNDPGYAPVPQEGSALLGDVPSDESLSAAIQLDDLAQVVPDILTMRQRLVERLLFGDLLGGSHGPLQMGSMVSPGGGGGLGQGGHSKHTSFHPEA